MTVTDIVPTTRVRVAGGCRVAHVEVGEGLHAGHAGRSSYGHSSNAQFSLFFFFFFPEF